MKDVFRPSWAFRPITKWWKKKVSPGIQELDGGFFEKFGTLLKEQSSKEEKIEEEKEEAAVVIPEPPKVIAEEDTEKLISDVIGLNIDELYSEVLYEILHIVGSDADTNEKEILFQYLKEAFKLDDEKHAELLQSAKEKEAPNILLNVEIVQAKDLKPKDANGLSDPFCTLYLTSSPSHRYNTSVKSETLSPVWEEHFSLPVESTVNDVLCLEVWDFDPAETVREKMTKITGVKGVRGLRKLMKEIAVTASTGKHDNEIIGITSIPLKTIPSSGHEKWYSLEKKSKIKSQGSIKLKMAFSSEKNNQVAAQEHRHLLRLLLLHEVENNKTEPLEWNGELTGSADIILKQHVAQSGLRPADEALAQWVEYVRLHVNHPLSFKIFSPLIEKLVQPIITGQYSEDELKLFWDAVKKYLPSALSHIKKLRKFAPGEKNNLEQLAGILSVIAKFCKLKIPDGIELFPISLYGWLQDSDQQNYDIPTVVLEAIRQSANDWYQQLLDSNKPTEDVQDSMLQQAIKVTQHVRADIQRAVEFHDKIFLMTVEIQYSQELYKIFDEKVCDLVEPLVSQICASLKPIRFKENMMENSKAADSLAMGTSLFELYLILQKFATLGSGMFPASSAELKTSKFHTWFYQGVAQWLDIAVFKALQRIDRAVELDELTPVDSSVKYSSSAVDTLSIFYQVKIFWQQLAWPDIEGSYTFVAKILDDICRCSVHYADKMGKRVESIGDTDSVYGKKFEVTNEWCLAINNIDYVRQSIKPFVTDLGDEDIIKSLAEFRNASAAEHCRQTLQLVIENAIETVRNKIIDLLETVAIKMAPAIRRFLLEGTELLNQDNNHVDRLMQYLDDNLITLHSQLNTDNFERIVCIIWEKLSNILSEVVEDSLEKRRPPSFFSNLNSTLNILIGFFKQGDKVSNNEVLDHIKHLLTLHGMETEELIHHYHLERLQDQRNKTVTNHGLLTVRVQFVNDLLRVEVMNARNLQPHDSNGSCDPYVKIHLLPDEKFANIIKPRTKTQKRNLFPLFDEIFTLQLTKEQRGCGKGLIQFLVKDQDFLGMSSQFVAEAFLAFSDIPVTDLDTSLQEMPQVHLKLSKPVNQDTDIFKALDHRQGEKLAKDFIKRLRIKMQPALNNGNHHN